MGSPTTLTKGAGMTSKYVARHVAGPKPSEFENF
jgi:hypothetical protein